MYDILFADGLLTPLYLCRGGDDCQVEKPLAEHNLPWREIVLVRGPDVMFEVMTAFFLPIHPAFRLSHSDVSWGLSCDPVLSSFVASLLRRDFFLFSVFVARAFFPPFTDILHERRVCKVSHAEVILV